MSDTERELLDRACDLEKENAELRECLKKNGENLPLVTGIRPADARLFSAAPELLAFAAAYYDRHKKNAIKQNPSNGDKYQDGLMVMCKKALVKAGLMDESEVWEEK